jgi:hypothetical protein
MTPYEPKRISFVPYGKEARSVSVYFAYETYCGEKGCFKDWYIGANFWFGSVNLVWLRYKFVPEQGGSAPHTN